MSDETIENNNKQLQPDESHQADITPEELRGWVDSILNYLADLNSSMREFADLYREKHDKPKTAKRKATKKKARRW